MTPDLPSPEAVRAACALRCWDDDCDDESRVLLEQAADTIRAQHDRLMRVSKLLEAAECEIELLRRFWPGSQKGGAA
jgi:hypothetical protein